MVTKLITLTPDMKLLDAAKLLIKNRISGAPVVDQDGNLIGVFSEKDVMSALIDAAYDEFPSAEVSSYMSRDLHPITEDVDLLTDRSDIQDARAFAGCPWFAISNWWDRSVVAT